MKKYDYLIVGSGLYGAIFAHEAKKRDKKCLIIDKRSHIGGNIYCENIEGINVHKYGAHIFHTSNKKIWDYVNSLVEFNRYTNSPVANYRGNLYNLPFNMNTFYQLWKVKTPAEAKAIIDQQVADAGIVNPQNLEEQALSLVGTDIYNTLIKEYTEKQWGRKATELPSFIIKRLPIRFTFDNNYFNDQYQGIPIGGYTKLIEVLLEDIEVKTGVNYFDNRNEWNELADQVIYTGMIDEYYDYKHGVLEYRSLKFEHTVLETPNYQGNAVVNYIDSEIPYTRIIEHKHFEFGEQKNTVITKEYPLEWTKKDEPYYPVNDTKNDLLFKKYKDMARLEEDVIFGGRLADYKYYDMHHVVGLALKKVEELFPDYRNQTMQIP
ncbi:UDP-galactopyranose mutase [Arcticibacter svalbardensis MN12-7]|uniref:UDP-galactopyranose mutase n=1 Tax=Arcticibacter svalbardensis MN12-7 TaxID=1150600 RepID=R9GRU9_9SPHI|nr:UDP-galactopyranose mutase [Arcticibacter svalbardensis]EOR94572.1 UDP-galactopyranose mutase [Arcticibacter svalbardensis MN12-7]